MIVSDKPISKEILFCVGDLRLVVMSAKSQWFGLGAQLDEETREELTKTVAGWANGLRRIPHA